MTTNSGGEQRSEGLGFQPQGKEGQVKKALQAHFTPEFLGRLDRIVSFQNLDEKAMADIVRKYLEALSKRTQDYGVQLQLPEELAATLCENIKSKDGARQLRRIVREKVELPLSDYLLRCGKKPVKLRLKLEGEALQFPN